MSIAFEIRPFREADESHVVSLWQRVFDADPPWNDPVTVIHRKLKIQRDLFLVGELGSRIVATVMAGYDGFRGWVYHLAVVPEERRRGFARAMMAEAESTLRELGCTKINLQIRESNSGAIDFYKSLGYEIEERVSMGKLLERR
jgi:ribosomal protein S18 acetylase RimI-like enzyme